MTIHKLQTRLIALMFSLTLSSYVIAEDTAQNENKYKGASNTFSDADDISHVGSDAYPALGKIQNTELISEAPSLEDGASAEEMYHQQREALRRYLENRHRQMNTYPDLSTDIESRRNQFIRDIEQRRKLIDKLYEYRRRAIEENRQNRLKDHHKTEVETPVVMYSNLKPE